MSIMDYMNYLTYSHSRSRQRVADSKQKRIRDDANNRVRKYTSKKSRGNEF